MSRLPVISGQQLINYLSHQGFEARRRKSGGSHVRMTHPDGRRTTVPLHRELGRGLVGDILDQAEISREEFLRTFGN